MNKLIQNAALYLYDLGFNVMPIPRVSMSYGGKKPPFTHWGNLQHCRISRKHIDLLFRDSNLAVICGRLSMNLFVIDCDSSFSYEFIGEILNSNNIETWAVQTERGGHFWFLSNRGEVQNSKPSPDVDLIGNRKYVVAPPSVHPKGVIYEWDQRPGDLPELVSPSWLGKILSFELSSKNSSNINVAYKVLVEKNAEDYVSNSEAEFASVLSLIGLNYTDDQIVEIFLKYRPPHTSSKRDPQQWLEKQMIQPARDVSGLKAHQLVNINLKLFPWSIRTEETDKRVFQALCTRAALENRTPFRASVREVAELANVTKGTASKSIKRLIKMGLVKWIDTDDISRAYRYKILLNIEDQKV